jgi:hypothetical protein
MKNKEWLARILPDENSVLQCSAVLTDKELLTLREACCLHLQGIAYSTANPEYEGHMLIWNVRKYSPVCTIPHPWKLHQHHTMRFLGLVILLSVLTCRTTFKMTTTNPLTPNDPYMGCIAPLTSRCCIFYIYSTNIGTEYFKHAAHSPFFFPLQNAVYFIMLPFLVPVLFIF